VNAQDELRLIRALSSEDISAADELKISRALDSGKGSADDILGRPKSNIGMDRAPSFSDLRASASDRDDGFDYDTGAAGGLRAKISFGETAEEKELILRKIVGEEGYTKDSKGLLALTEAGQLSQGMEPIGQNLIIEDEGFSMRDISDLAGIAPETIGAVIGGVLGAPGLVTGAVGAAAGAGLGQAAEEGIESLLGIQRQSLGEVGIDVAREAALAGTLDFAGNAIFKLGKMAIGAAGKGVNAGARAMGQVERELGADQANLALKIMDADVPGQPSYAAAGMPAGIAKASQIAGAIGGNEQKEQWQTSGLL